MTAPASPRITRRQLIIGGSAAAAGAVLLGACGDEGTSGTETTASTGPDGGGGELSLAQFFGGPMFVAGDELRLPFGVADVDGLLPSEDTPESLSVDVLGPDGSAVAEGVEVRRHHEGLPRAYFPLRVTVEASGIYTVRAEIGDSATEMSFQVLEAEDVKVIRPGTPMPAVDTPTIDDPRGVNPVCTNDPVCPLHDTTLSAAVAEGSPVALLVSTPAFCQLAICGPVLDVLLGAADDYPDVRFLHAEVYADPANGLEEYAPVVEALGLHFEPCLVLVGSDGTVADRVDVIYDDAELRERLDALG